MVCLVDDPFSPSSDEETKSVSTPEAPLPAVHELDSPSDCSLFDSAVGGGMGDGKRRFQNADGGDHLDKWRLISQTQTADDEKEEEEKISHEMTSQLGNGLGGPSSGFECVDKVRELARLIVASRYFDAAIGFVIAVNSFCIGIDQSLQIEGKTSVVLEVVEHTFVCIYILELLLRCLGAGGNAQTANQGGIFCCGLRMMLDKWMIFDIVIVTISIMTQWVLDEEQVEAMGPIVVIRLARLARLARTLRLLVLFRELWMLLHGLIASTSMMFYTMCILSGMIYAFSLLGVEIITLKHASGGYEHLPAVEAIVVEYFGSVTLTMLTLTQFITLDSIGSIYRPLIREDPILAFYFMSLILVVGIVLMNLVTAVLVNGALEQAHQNKEAQQALEEKQKKKLMKKLRKMFDRLDEDGSGNITVEEMLSGTAEDMALLVEMAKNADPVEVFTSLDYDGSGQLDIEEFCDGMYQATISQTPVELRRIDKRVEGVGIKQGQIKEAQQDLLRRLDRLDLLLRQTMNLPSEPCLSRNQSRKSSKNLKADSEDLRLSGIFAASLTDRIRKDTDISADKDQGSPRSLRKRSKDSNSSRSRGKINIESKIVGEKVNGKINVQDLQCLPEAPDFQPAHESIQLRWCRPNVVPRPVTTSLRSGLHLPQANGHGSPLATSGLDPG